MTKCEKHNWLVDEFDEPCPFCEAVSAERERFAMLVDDVAALLVQSIYKED